MDLNQFHKKIKVCAAPSNCNKQKKIFCPFKTVIKFMEFRGPYKKEDDPFFVLKDNSHVQSEQVRKTLRLLLTSLNLDGNLYDFHSFRIGRTCDLEKFGYPITVIKSMGRWKSNAVYRYLRN